LKPCIVTLIKNMNGNHVAQRCLQYLMPEYSEVRDTSFFWSELLWHLEGFFFFLIYPPCFIFQNPLKTCMKKQA